MIPAGEGTEPGTLPPLLAACATTETTPATTRENFSVLSGVLLEFSLTHAYACTPFLATPEQPSACDPGNLFVRELVRLEITGQVEAHVPPVAALFCGVRPLPFPHRFDPSRNQTHPVVRERRATVQLLPGL
eukprot:CAMPEP_0197128450 /NCGR_PEP_ID=MMETSP1390-20130617/14651_1 /TAXON_ID=38833 /ORGANISM="Micromonas sp., Strain CCMP2099" /LENGTH=131 /DNA_ID=CAMNT_0042570815 /DNA_START=789 /DNA_END=1186 /DNA_ORIENTATION=-